jgi:23S rRNA (uridine2552-2'-O)-methyltransferase
VSKSNKEWLRRHVTDPYVRKAKAQGYRSRAAFKLLEINQKEKLLRPGIAVLDLGAAPGGWSQVAAEKVKPGGKVLAVDVLRMEPIPGVTFVQGDFRDLAGDPADVVLSDVSPNMSGIRNVDQARALELSLAAVDLCEKALRPEGAFLVKVFQGEAFDELLARLKQVFTDVKVIKPAASRDESRETYLLARRLSRAA